MLITVRAYGLKVNKYDGFFCLLLLAITKPLKMAGLSVSGPLH